MQLTLRSALALGAWACAAAAIVLAAPLANSASAQGIGSVTPNAAARASTWHPDLVREADALTTREIRARGVHQVLSPVVDVARDPRWGEGTLAARPASADLEEIILQVVE